MSQTPITIFSDGFEAGDTSAWSVTVALIETKLTGSGAATFEAFGYSVSLDGDTAVIGADGNRTNGSAYVFTRDAQGAWTEQARISVPGTGFGDAVAVDGDTAAVGAWLADDAGRESGSAYVFSRDAGGLWTQQAKLVVSDPAEFGYFGYSASVNLDTIVIGAIGASGSAYVFTRDAGGVWSQQAKLTASDAASGDGFGISVSVDGDTAVVGACWNDDSGTSSGSAYVFTRDVGGVWIEQAKLVASDASAGDELGYSVSLDGDAVIVGAIADEHGDTGAGSAYVFARDDVGTWTEWAKLATSDTTGVSWFGYSVSLDGDSAVIGAPYNGLTGSAYLFTRDAGGTWSEHAKLLASDATWSEIFGASVSLDGNTIVIGAWGDNDNGTESGSVYVYTQTGTAFSSLSDLRKRAGSE